MTDDNGIQDKGVQQRSVYFLPAAADDLKSSSRGRRLRRLQSRFSLGGKVVTPKVTWSNNKSWKTTFWYLISVWVSFFGNLSCLQYKHRAKEDFNILVLPHVKGRKQRRRHQPEWFTQNSKFENIASLAHSISLFHKFSQTQTWVFLICSFPTFHAPVDQQTYKYCSIGHKEEVKHVTFCYTYHSRWIEREASWKNKESLKHEERKWMKRRKFKNWLTDLFSKREDDEPRSNPHSRYPFMYADHCHSSTHKTSLSPFLVSEPFFFIAKHANKRKRTTFHIPPLVSSRSLL